MNNGADELDKRIAVLLCQMIDTLHFHTTLFDEVGAERVKHWIKSRAGSGRAIGTPMALFYRSDSQASSIASGPIR